MRAITRRGVLGLAAGLPLAVSGPARIAGAQTAARVLSVASQALPPSMEPADRPGLTSVAYRVQHSVLEGLLRLDYRDNMRVEPALAERYRQVDATTWEFTLRSGVKFHDGRVLTADDVVFSLGPERLTGPEAPGRATRSIFQPTLAGAVKVDDRTVRLTTVAPDPVFEKRLAGWGAQIVGAQAYRGARSFEQWAAAPVGTGPYKVAELRRDDVIMLAAHADYWRGVPPLAGIRFKAVPELASRVAGLMAGDYDIVTDLTPDQIALIERRPGFRVAGGPANVSRMVIFDVRHNPQLADVNLRRAMILAVDRDLLIESLWHGRSVSNGYQTPAYGALYDPARPKPAYDLERARALVAQSSYRGERIALRTTGSYYVAELATTQALIEMWRTVGITVAIEAVENYAQWYQRPGSGLYNYSSVMVYPDPLSDVARNFGPNSQLQTIEDSWVNEEFNRLCAALSSTLDETERRRIFARMLDIMDWDDPPAVPLFMQSLFYGLRADIDWTPFPAHQMDFGPGSVRVGATR